MPAPAGFRKGKNMAYEIFVDLSLDIEPKVVTENNIHFIPMEYEVGEESVLLQEPPGEEQVHEFYEDMRKNLPAKSTAISPRRFRQIFGACLETGQSILYISLSGGLSPTCKTAEQEALALKEKFGHLRIEVVDSRGASFGMGLLVEAACGNREKGMSLEENAAFLRGMALRINYWFIVEDLSYLKRSGKISGTSPFMDAALNIRPLFTIKANGSLDTVGKKRGSRQAMHALAECFAETYDASYGTTVYLCCADCTESAEELKEILLETHPLLEIKIRMLNPVIGAHTGPGMVSIIHFGRKRE